MNKATLTPELVKKCNRLAEGVQKMIDNGATIEEAITWGMKQTGLKNEVQALLAIYTGVVVGVRE